ncbi:MAG: zinc-ribbon domain-containing protein [Solirubrobacterales bacterium]
MSDLEQQRDRLLEKFTVMQADLGGAFYEMAIRDHVRLDVLTRKAAELQRVDAELLAVERMLALEQVDAAGLCASCGAPYGPADRFCPQCGSSLAPVGAAA